MATYKGIQGYTVQKLSSDPTLADTIGQLWYNSTSGKYRISTSVSGVWASSATYGAQARTRPGSAGTQTATLGWQGMTAAAAINESYEYNGTTWSPAVSMNRNPGTQPGGFGVQTAAVSGGYYDAPGPGSPPAGGRNTCEEYNGTAWSTVNSTQNTAFNRIGAGTQTAGLEAGGYYPSPSPYSICELYDGTSWTETNNLNTARSYSGPHCGTSTAALCISGSAPPETTAVESWNGTSWSEENDINTARSSSGSSGTTTLALIYGGNKPGIAADITETWNGTSWTETGDMGSGRQEAGSGGTTNASAITFAGGNPTIVGPTAPTGYFDSSEEWNDPVLAIKTVTVS